METIDDPGGDIPLTFLLFHRVILRQEEKIMNPGCTKICGIDLETQKKVKQFVS